MLRREVRDTVSTADRAAQRYTDALAEVRRVPGEDDLERRAREVLHLGLTRWLPMLLDRKDRLSMAHGLEVRVPFCDHRLVEYVWNVPWAMKTTGGVEKGLLRQAVGDLLPPAVLERRKSIYPGPADTHYEQAITSQLAMLLAQPDAPLFALIDHAELTTAFQNDPRLPGPCPCSPDRPRPRPTCSRPTPGSPNTASRWPDPAPGPAVAAAPRARLVTSVPTRLATSVDRTATRRPLAVTNASLVPAGRGPSESVFSQQAGTRPHQTSRRGKGSGT